MMAGKAFHDLEVYRLAEQLTDRIRRLVAPWDWFAKNTVGRGAATGLVAGTGLAEDDGGPQHPLGAVVGGLDPFSGEKGKQVLPLFAQPAGDAGVVGIGQPAALVDEGIKVALGLGQAAPAAVDVWSG